VLQVLRVPRTHHATYHICDEQDIKAMQTDLDEIAKWVTQNRMKVNGRKTCSIAFCKTREVIGLNYTLREILIPQEQYCKYLGVYLNSSFGVGRANY
jgi:hypothetical protein